MIQHDNSLNLTARVLACVVEYKIAHDGAWPPDAWILDYLNLDADRLDTALKGLRAAGAIYVKGGHMCIKGGKWICENAFPTSALLKMASKKGKE